MMTYAALLKWAVRELEDAGIEGARREAELLLAFTLGIRREDLYLMNFQTEVAGDGDASIARFRTAVARRVAREPLAYITGVKEFYGLTFTVDQRVLIPRPETELLVELCLEQLKLRSQEPLLREQCQTSKCDRRRSIVVADICTGSGAVGIAVAVNQPDVIVLASDISAAALAVATGNAQRHGVSDRIIFAQGDLFAPWQRLSSRTRLDHATLDRVTLDCATLDCAGMDVILCNPPYIPQDDIAILQPEIRDYEPRQALEAGPDGLSFYRRIFSEAGAFLNQNGLLLAEIGDGQQDAVLHIAQENGWKAVTVPDLAGIARVVTARRG
ncbi:MAG: peptide chain release factor N(5)-glutamine methyltransferase [Bacillota bacterium]|jgi:release factor glutamine methyltransferase